MNIYWYEQSVADVPTGEAWLSPAEVDHLRSMRFRKRRSDWLLGRWTAKNAVAILLDLQSKLPDLRDIEVRPTNLGAPEVFLRTEPAAISISLSHREGVAVCTLAPAGVLLGCDLEIVEAHSEAFASDYFSAEEQALAAQVAPAERARILTLLWSSKESALKALREGLRVDTRGVIVSVQGMLEPQNEGTGNPSRCSSSRIAEFSRDNGWHPLEVRKTTGQILQGWWSQRRELIRTVLAVPPPDPPILMTKHTYTQICAER